MPTTLWIRLTELAVVAILALSLLFAWRAEREDRAQLAAELATAKQALAAADSRQHDRDTQLLQTLSALATEKRTVTTPAEILRELAQRIPLPSPITLQPAPSASLGDTKSIAQSSNMRPDLGAKSSLPSAPIPTQAILPAEDLKPLYDFTLDCQGCQAKLAAAQGDLTDERAKTATLTKERDVAIRAAKGGSALQRLGRAAKWFAIGAAAGAIAMTARGH